MTKIRAAERKDLPAIKKLIRRYPEKLLQEHLPRAADFFVAEKDGKVVGCCALQVYSRRLAEVRSLAVDRCCQRQGIGSRLIKRCVNKAKGLGIHELLSITGATGLFERQGFGTFNKERFALFKVLDRS